MAYCHACSLADKPPCEPGCLDVMVLPYLPEATSRLGWREYQLGWETLNSQTTCWSEHLQGSHTVCYHATSTPPLLRPVNTCCRFQHSCSCLSWLRLIDDLLRAQGTLSSHRLGCGLQVHGKTDAFSFLFPVSLFLK